MTPMTGSPIPPHHPTGLSEVCSVCLGMHDAMRAATHKVAEVVETDWPVLARKLRSESGLTSAELNVSIVRHELTNFLCCEHFGLVMGPMASAMCESEPAATT